jgi:hypothetical protein
MRNKMILGKIYAGKIRLNRLFTNPIRNEGEVKLGQRTLGTVIISKVKIYPGASRGNIITNDNIPKIIIGRNLFVIFI